MVWNVASPRRDELPGPLDVNFVPFEYIDHPFSSSVDTISQKSKNDINFYTPRNILPTGILHKVVHLKGDDDELMRERGVR